MNATQRKKIVELENALRKAVKKWDSILDGKCTLSAFNVDIDRDSHTAQLLGYNLVSVVANMSLNGRKYIVWQVFIGPRGAVSSYKRTRITKGNQLNTKTVKKTGIHNVVNYGYFYVMP